MSFVGAFNPSLIFDDGCDGSSEIIHFHGSKPANHPDKPFRVDSPHLQCIQRGGLRKSIRFRWLDLDVPEVSFEKVFPFRYRDNHFYRQSPDRIGTDDYRWPLFLNLRTTGRVEVNDPDFSSSR
jgi:hypothetical protein